jgi:hypothetical protein
MGHSEESAADDEESLFTQQPHQTVFRRARSSASGQFCILTRTSLSPASNK